MQVSLPGGVGETLLELIRARFGSSGREGKDERRVSNGRR